MKILLLNENPVVSRLISLSAKKMSYDFEELNAYNENLGYYDVIVVDSDTPVPLKILKEKCERLIFLAPRNQNIDIDAQILQKPFLPTDFLNLLNNKDANKHISTELPMLGNDDNPYADISLNLDNLNLDDLPNENSLDVNSDGMEDLSFDDEAQDSHDASKTLDTQNLEDENLEQETTKEQTEEDVESDLDLSLDNSENEKEDLTQEHTALDTDPNLDELEDENSENLEDNKELQANISDFDDLPVVEEQEKEMDFDDLPEDAEFLGQVKDNEESEEALEDFTPVVEEDIQDEIDDSISNLSTQDQIKEELAQLDELDYGIDGDNSSKVLEDFKDKPILDDKELGIDEEKVVVPNLNISDFDALKESDIQKALGEEVLEKDEEFMSDTTKNDNNEEIVNELSQSIAGAITSSIKDDTLKAALKGMNMNININISFKED
ncbi:TPA: hypothetical protein RTF98_000013 [Campylobacter jejuni]|nr:hypothetical protein [Campylobacter jejuni]HDZ4976307.1 hypothetical protein [Campylobacter jejuni]HDZ4998352.1 hypothetical protein [Campylobacter jejuni]HDZ5013568.1 hypothetical protein [Campylobacter jejuni]HDZ5036481.1 hypothetical protein [Campylobacter jejuni]